jgi:phage gpG-like protein
LIEAREIARQSTEAHFDSESDPQGNKWEPLSKDWEKDPRKADSGHPDDILQLTGAGREAAISEDAYFISEGEIWFNPGALPDYMALHQSGTRHEGLDEAFATIEQPESAALVSEHYGRGKGLPKREFIGFDEVDILELQEVFNAWFAANIMEFFPEESFPGGGTTATGFNVLGEFPIISTTKLGQPILRTPGGPRFGRK